MFNLSHVVEMFIHVNVCCSILSWRVGSEGLCLAWLMVCTVYVEPVCSLALEKEKVFHEVHNISFECKEIHLAVTLNEIDAECGNYAPSYCF